MEPPALFFKQVLMAANTALHHPELRIHIAHRQDEALSAMHDERAEVVKQLDIASFTSAIGSNTIAGVFRNVLRHVFIDTAGDGRQDCNKCTGMCLNMCLDMCLDMCVSICL